MQILQIGKEDGFTLMEILIVLVLIMAFIAVNLPDFHHFIESIERRGQIQQVEHFFRALREKSIVLQRELDVEINESGLFCKQESDIVANIELLVTGENTRNIILYPDGSCSGGAFSINVLDRYCYTVNVDPVTGKLEWLNKKRSE